MVEAAGVLPGDTVLEIGPGTGALTRELLQSGARVIALEADERAITILKETFPEELTAGMLTLHHSDVREVDYRALDLKEHGYSVVANIPYYLSGHLFRLFLETNIQPKTIVFLVQKEVAERIARDPKESLLSLSVKVYGDPTYIGTVKRGNFTPPPKVDSAIIAITRISRERFGGVPETFFFELLHLGFASKRKQLLGNLAEKYPRDVLSSVFSTLGLDPKVRGEDVPLSSWISLAKTLVSTT